MKNKLSLFAFLAIAAAIGWVHYQGTPEYIIAWDQFGYYLYLPLTFIYNDIEIKDYSLIETLMQKYQPLQVFYQGIHLENGNWVIRYTSGLALLYSPGFFAGHLFAYLLGYSMDGFSAPYQYAMLIWSMLFLIAGMHYLRLILLHFFSDKLSAFIMLLVFFGTNILLTGITLVHPYLFTLFAIMLWYTIKWHQTHKFSSAAVIAFTLGLAAIVRPTEMLYAIVPVLWGVSGWQSFRKKMAEVWANYRMQAVAAAAIIFCTGCVQLFYWKKVTGHFLYDSYGANAGEGFDFPPYLMEFLFSYRKGWLLYTPLMLFALAGFAVLYRRKHGLFWPAVVFFAAFIFVVSSWTYWWYASCYSQRTMTQIYPLLAVSLGFFFQWAWTGQFYIKAATVMAAVLLVGLNLFQSWQFRNGIIDGERMTKNYYWAVFGRTTVPEGAQKLLLFDRFNAPARPEDGSGYSKRVMLETGFEKDDKAVSEIASADTLLKFAGPAALVDSLTEFFNLLETQAGELVSRDHSWVRVRVRVMPLAQPGPEGPLLVITFLHNGKSYGYRTFPLASDTSGLLRWNDFTADYLTPAVRSGNDKLQVYIWNRSKNRLALDEAKIELLEPVEGE